MNLPIPKPANGPIYSPGWADLLEVALTRLWDGKHDPDRNYDHTWICCCIPCTDEMDKEVKALREEITRRLGGGCIGNYSRWLESRLGACPVECISLEDIQGGRRAWCLSMIEEFRNEKNCYM